MQTWRPSSSPRIVAQPVVPQNVAIPHPNVGHPHINQRNQSSQRENIDNGHSDQSSPLPSLPTDTEFNYHSAEGSTDSPSESEEFERTIDWSDHQNWTLTPAHFTLNDFDSHMCENVSPTNCARSHSPLWPTKETEVTKINPFATSSKVQRAPNPFAASSKVQQSPIPVPRQFTHTDVVSAFPVPPPRTTSLQRETEVVVDPFRRSTLTPAEAAQIPPVFRLTRLILTF